MKMIYKYPLVATDYQVVSMPAGAELLSVQVQNDVVCVWARVDTDRPSVGVTFHMRGTGHEADLPASARFLGTVQLHGGKLVFHVFAEVPPYELR